MHWISHWTGLDNGSGAFYLFWSGFGSFLLSLSVLGGLIGVWRKHLCHQDRCWRFARHPIEIDGVGHALCRKHHPGTGGRLTSERIVAAHRLNRVR